MAERKKTVRITGPRRLLLVFAASVLLPAVALAVLAYGQVGAERRALAAGRGGGIRRAERRIRGDLLAAFDALRREEEDRPWFHYNPLYYDPKTVGEGLNYLPSPIAGEPSNPLVSGYFQVRPDGQITSPNDTFVGQTAAQGAPDYEVEVAQQAVAEQVQQKLLPNLDQNRSGLPPEEKGNFENGGGRNSAQWLGKKGFEANFYAPAEIDRIVNGVGSTRVETAREDGEPVEVIVSALRFESDGEGGVFAWRYADVPRPVVDLGLQTYDRFVQGFRVNVDYVRTQLFAELVGRYVNLDGVRAVLVPGGEGPGAATEPLPPLPGWRLFVTDEDPESVSRRVASLSGLLLTAAGLALLAITGGLLFTLRAVREELALARRRSDFVAAVTHELRTPLTGIKMYADMLKAGWVKDEATRDEYVGFMADETDRLARLVNRVLDFARSERKAPDVVALDLSGPVRAVERDFGPHLAADGFALAVDLRTTRRALADADAVKQILLNLLDNARKYAAAAGDRRIEVVVAEEGERILLSVADHGPGVPEAERERIFEDFYRPGEELTRETPGAGIGLALVRRLARSMGARAAVAETPGGGATFRIAFRQE